MSFELRYVFHFIDPEAFEDDGGSRLKVDENLLITGQTNIYAIGDCCNTKVCNNKHTM